MQTASKQLFESITSYRRLAQLVEDGETEGQHLECKSPSQPRLGRDLKVTLAKAVSGFGNTDGGVIIWGVSTTKHAHSGLDVLSQVEPVAAAKTFERQVNQTIPSLTTPLAGGIQSKVLYRRKSDTRGVVLTHIPKHLGDPLQSTIDSLFYFRSGDAFHVAPYEMVKRLFTATSSPDLRPVFVDDLVSVAEDGAWKIPIILQNQAAAIGEHVVVLINILNPDACEEVRSDNFADVSDVNPGRKMLVVNFPRVIHRGMNEILGHLNVKMKVQKRARRRLDLVITTYANRMRARQTEYVVTLARKAFSVKTVSDDYLY